MPVFDTGLSILGNNSTWTPVWRDERSYTVSTNLTKVAGQPRDPHGLRLRAAGADPLAAGSRQPARRPLRSAAASPARPAMPASAAGTATPAFLLGQMSSYGKSVQFEEMTGRENQYGLYVADRWQVNEKLTLNLGPPLRVLPADDPCRPRHRAARLQHLQRRARRPRRQPDRTWASTSARRCSRRASARRTASTTTRCSAPATAGRSTRCRGRARCAAGSR